MQKVLPELQKVALESGEASSSDMTLLEKL
jgi:hypothetical protein